MQHRKLQQTYGINPTHMPYTNNMQQQRQQDTNQLHRPSPAVQMNTMGSSDYLRSHLREPSAASDPQCPVDVDDPADRTDQPSLNSTSTARK